MNTIKVAILGLGTVGTGVYKLIQKRADVMERTAGAKLEVKKILVRNMQKKREGVEQELLTDNWKEILEDDEISVVIEVMGGLEPAKTMILEALEAGKNVVSANKDLIAEEGHVLLDTAQKNQVDFLFEAAVAGGIPIIRPLKQCLAANDISEIVGIVNGTTNYILTKMTEEGIDFADALKKAQELGFAEADPTADVEGLDAGRKWRSWHPSHFIPELYSLMYIQKELRRLRQGILHMLKEFDSVIKLLGVAHNTENGIEVGVYPMMIRKEHPLASVRDSFNAVFVHGDAVDDAMFYGRGAGEFPTASAVMGDVIDVVRNIGYGCTGRISCTCYKDLPIKEFGQVKNKFFIRMQVANEPGVLAAIAEVFGDHKVSITRVVQEHSAPEAAELVIVTERVKECNMQEALKALMEIPSIQEISSIIREY
mgnify:FL=1